MWRRNKRQNQTQHNNARALGRKEAQNYYKRWWEREWPLSPTYPSPAKVCMFEWQIEQGEGRGGVVDRRTTFAYQPHLPRADGKFTPQSTFQMADRGQHIVASCLGWAKPSEPPTPPARFVCCVVLCCWHYGIVFRATTITLLRAFVVVHVGVAVVFFVVFVCKSCLVYFPWGCE